MQLRDRKQTLRYPTGRLWNVGLDCTLIQAKEDYNRHVDSLQDSRQ